jgi:hypothetical protein
MPYRRRYSASQKYLWGGVVLLLALGVMIGVILNYGGSDSDQAPTAQGQAPLAPMN